MSSDKNSVAKLHSIDLRVEGVQGKIYAGMRLPVTVYVKCDNGCDLSDLNGSTVRIFNSENVELCATLINRFENGIEVEPIEVEPIEVEPIGVELKDNSYNSDVGGDANTPSDSFSVMFTLEAPNEPGDYTWRIQFEAAEGSLYNSSHEAMFSFTVQSHEIILSAWGAPSPVNRGEEFIINIGARCIAGCSLAGLPIAIRDEEGNLIASGNLGDEVLANTAGTYWVAQQLIAPDDEGVYTYAVDCDNIVFDLTHKVKATEFTFRTVAPPEYYVTVNILKKHDGFKIEGANIMLGFHKSITGEDGSVILHVPGGEQILRASRIDYVSYSGPHTIEGDCEITIELEFNPAT